MFDLKKVSQVAHGGQGELRFCRPFQQEELRSALNFVDFVEIPPGVSIGLHRHGQEEEIYFVVSGIGEMTLEKEHFEVRRGDLIRNLPGGQHSLLACGAKDLHLLVFEAGVGVEE